MRDYVLTLLVTAVVTYMLTPLVRRTAIRAGALREARDRDVHVVPVPRFGGLAMFGGLAAGLFVADQLPQLRDGFANTGMITGLLAAGGLLVIIGVIDDRWGMSALAKLAGQVAAGGILVATGTQLSWLPLPGGRTFIPTADQQTLLTILVVVATINAVNFIDGLDGLAAGIVAIAAISFFLYYYSMTRVIDISSLAAPALASAILIGMCLGFLPHNFSPASIFMGDTGSMLLGLLLAYAPISSISSLDPAVLSSRINRYPEILPLLLPAALLVIPYVDLLLAVVRRTRAGTSPFAADRKHLHHRLLDIGHSQRRSVLIMYLWAALFSGSVVFLSIEKTVRGNSANHHGQPVFVLVAVTAAAMFALLLMSMPRLRWWEGRGRRSVAGTGPKHVAAGRQPDQSVAQANGASPDPVTAGANGASPEPVTAGANGAGPDPVTATADARESAVPSPSVGDVRDRRPADGYLSSSSQNGFSSNGRSPRHAEPAAPGPPENLNSGPPQDSTTAASRSLFEHAASKPRWSESDSAERLEPDDSDATLIQAVWADDSDASEPSNGRGRSIIGTIPPAIGTPSDSRPNPLPRRLPRRDDLSGPRPL